VIRKIIFLAICFVLPFVLISCTVKETGSVTKPTGKTINSLISQPDNSTFSASSTDVVSEAQKLSSSPGRVALSLIICRLDNSYHLNELSQKDIQDLLSILSETSSQKAVTLEALDAQFNLRGILATEGMTVTIKANQITVVSNGSAPANPDNSWIAPFEKAINSSK
jgi:hypothetical protein